jgi:hypothetical protein
MAENVPQCLVEMLGGMRTPAVVRMQRQTPHAPVFRAFSISGDALRALNVSHLVVYVNRAANACGPLQVGLKLEKTLVANSFYSFRVAAYSIALATGSRAAKCEQRVGARGVPANQASTRTRLIAAAVMRGCRCALAWSIERQRRRHTVEGRAQRLSSLLQPIAEDIVAKI